ncbi:MAG: hypothetical protein NVSMB51_01780 [Solirubrobacteraceae bacterium]
MHKPLPLLALFAATAIAGCGGGSSAAPLSKSDFVARGNAVCTRVNTGIRGVGRTTTAADVVREAPKVHAIEQRGVGDLRRLSPPREFATDWSRMLGDLQMLTDNTAKIGDAARRNDAAAAGTIAKASSAIAAQVNTLALKLGLTSCAQGGR